MTREEVIAQLVQRLDLWHRQAADKGLKHQYQRAALAKAEELRVVLEMLAKSDD